MVTENSYIQNTELKLKENTAGPIKFFKKKEDKKKNFFCQVCNKAFRDNYKLKRHEKVHIKSGELVNPSEDCSYLEDEKPLHSGTFDLNSFHFVMKIIKVSKSRKEILGSSILPRNELENFNFCPSLLGQKFFVRFFGRIENTKKTFRN